MVLALGVVALLTKQLLGISIPLIIPTLIIAVLIVAIWAWIRSAAWQPDYRDIARRIEQQHPDLHALLLTAVEQRPDPQIGRLHYLQQRVIDQALAESGRHQWIAAVSTKQLWGMSFASLGTLAALVAVLLGLRLAPPASVLQASMTTARKVTVAPGDALVERGSGVIVTARFDGSPPTEVTLVIGSHSNDTRRVPLIKSLDDPVFGGSIPEVSSNLVYHIEFANEQTREFKIAVFDYPSLQRADAHIAFPDYTGLSKKTIENTRRVSAVEGSQLEVVMQLNKPVVSARLIGKDKSIVPLHTETNTPQATLEDFPLKASQTYELQLVDVDGRTNKVPAQFVIDVLKNRKPELKFLAPRGDQKVSPLEEVSFQGEAWDDFGLRDYGLTYTVAGKEAVSMSLGTNSPANEKHAFGHLLKLEELQVVPDQLISYFLWADDIGPDGQVRRTASDMFFAEVRALEEIFREAEGQDAEGGGQSGQGNQATKLAELQKEIISATWKLKRQETGPTPSANYKTDAQVVKDSQEQALEQASMMKGMTTDPRAEVLLAGVEEAMEKAVEHLTKAVDKTEALTPSLDAEQAAYQALLKLSAHEYLISRSRNRSSQGGGGQQNQRQLDQLELKQAEDRYETQSQATPQQTAEQREQLQVLNRLKELAQRQQDLNERIKELQTALQEAQTESEREEIRRRLKRLREEEQELLADVDELRQRMERPENQSRMAEAREQLERTRSQVQRAAEALERNEVSQALAEGTRAQRDLQQLRDDFRKKNSSQFAEDMRQMRDQARQLAQNQEDIGKKLEELADNKRKTLSDSEEAKALNEKFGQQKTSLTNLLSNMREVSEKSETSEPLLSRQLYDTFRKASQDNTENSLNLSQELLKHNFTSEAGQFEQRARQEIDDLKRGVERAAESVLGDDTEALRLAKRELDSLAEQLNREIAQNAPDLAQNLQRGGRQQDGQTNGVAGSASENERSAAQQGNEGEGQQRNQQAEQQGQQAGQGQQAQRGEQGQQGQEEGQGQQGQRAQQSQNQQGQQAQGEAQGQQTELGQQAQNGEQGQQQGQQAGQGQQQSERGQQAQRGQQGQEGEGQQGQQAQQSQQNQQGQGQGQQGQQPGQGQQPSQQAQQPGQGQQAQQNQQAQRGQQGQQGQGGQPGQQPGQQGIGGQVPGDERNPQQAQTQDRTTQRRGGRNQASGSGGDSSTVGPEFFRNFFDQEGGQQSPFSEGPLTGPEYTQWSDRLREVEEMVDVPELRGELSRVRERARQMRTDFKRHSKQPQWPLVRSQISEPLAEIRQRVAEELAKRESSDSLVPIDRDPVPQKFSDLVRRYYEKLGSGKE
jgi:hypothetical protein